MTDKVKKVYSKLSLEYKIGIFICFAVLTLTTLVLVVFAQSGIGFSNHTPEGITGDPQPAISVDVSSVDHVLAEDNIQMLLNGNQVTPVLSTISESVYNVTYTPPDKLADANYTASVIVSVDDPENPGLEITETTVWEFTIDAAPKASYWQPAKDSKVTVADPTVSVYVKDTFDDLDEDTLTAKLNGNPVTASLEHPGQWVDDGCEAPKFVPDTRQEGTVSFDTSDLANGTHTVEISIADTEGNVLTETWDFLVSREVQFSNQSPGSKTGSTKPAISVTAVDGDAVMDRDDINMFINDVPVTPAISDYLDGIKISYTPQEKLPDGIYNIRVEVFEITKDDYDSISWNFEVDAAPNPIDWFPAKNSTITTADPTITLEVQDTNDSLDAASVSAKINGITVSESSVSFETYTETGSCGKTWYYYDRGKISVNAAGLENGIHTVEISIADVLGNTLTETWSFTVEAPPEFTDLYPVHESKDRAIDRISAAIINGGEIDWGTVKVKINNTYVDSNDLVFDLTENTVTFYHNFSDGKQEIYMEVQDDLGGLGSVNWSFTVDNTPPQLDIKNNTTNNNFINGLVIDDGYLRISGRLTDSLSDIKENVEMKLNGETLLSLNAGMLYYVDPCASDGNTVHRNLVDFEYEAIIPNGEYTLEIYAEDELGNSTTYTRSFTVETYPIISQIAPIKYGVDQLTPTISASIISINQVIDSITLKINGEAVDEFNYDPSTGAFTYTPVNPLDDEDYHSVSLSAVDDSGLSTSQSWQFYITTYADMYDANIESCTACHTNIKDITNNNLYDNIMYAHNYIWEEHEENGYHSNTSGCLDCHNSITTNNNCNGCHSTGGSWGPWYGTGTSANSEYNFKLINYDGYFPLRVELSRENWDCIVCHQPGTSIESVNSHDIPELHRTTELDTPVFCTQCHASSLTREHARDGRFDQEGYPIDCNTCHESTDANVMAAINSGDKDCLACHADEDIGFDHVHFDRFDHNVSYGAKCVECHSENMLTEKQYHENDCYSCHASTDPKHTIAVDTKKDNCFACHTQPHDVYMALNRRDIPMYPGAVWSVPDDALYWQHETWMPQDIELSGAEIIFSQRDQLSSGEIYSFFQAEMVAAGWTLLTDTYTPDAPHFELRYYKNEGAGIQPKVRYALIWYYSGNKPGTGTPDNGSRVQLLYH
ncbi:hypothetical protein [Dethiobacter alkaliphilus]|uniref:hypothetical protein n=1 Tax=Dethiobacter alkaliphilus TaxID=427926 RepID=UPI002226010A|nr:hypothetical protein [Dethiobacter alkaliphilus]MCW3491154.1 hypothetical protein [Dethiobacter alkaliphilus]